MLIGVIAHADNLGKSSGREVYQNLRCYEICSFIYGFSGNFSRHNFELPFMLIINFITFLKFYFKKKNNYLYSFSVPRIYFDRLN